MPPKGRDGSAKGKKDNKNETDRYQPSIIVTRLMRTYKSNCEVTESAISPRLIKSMEKCIEDNTFLVQLILDVNNDSNQFGFPVKLEPLIKAIRSERYTHIKELYLWSYNMCLETFATLCNYLDAPMYHIKHMELRECLLISDHMRRFAEIIRKLNSLTYLNLDYNRFGDEGCYYLCIALEGNNTLLTLSMNFCRLGPISGTYLNDMINLTCVCNISLDGNHLRCEGMSLLIGYAVDMAVDEDRQRVEAKRIKEIEREESKKHALSTGKGAKTPTKKKKGKKKSTPERVPFGPWIRSLSLADNTIDNQTQDSERAVGMSMQSIGTLIATSSFLQELDFNDNLIGNMAALQLLDGLKQRSANELPPIKLRTTHRIDKNIFIEIKQLASGVKKKGKMRRKKK